ncbi:MAG: hypothetical protein IT260_18385 [Saprospiraceae bacterium]|nr:hypothetical protein [Saprospiraceae bacterium]
MLALFRNNQTTTSLELALYVVILHLPAMVGWVPMPEGLSSRGGLLFGDVLGWAITNPKLSALAATALVFGQAVLLNLLADRYRMMDDRNWIPGLMYALVASSIPDFQFLSPALLGATFIPIALLRLYGVYKQNLAFGAIFDTAFWLSLGCLFHPPVAWCLVPAFMGFFNLRSFSAREQVIFMTGIFVPVFLGFTLYFWLDQPGAFWVSQFREGLAINWFSFSGHALATQLKFGLVAAMLLVVVLGFNVYYFKKLIQVQKYITILFWFLLANLVAALIHGGLRPEYFLLLMPSVAMFFAYAFLSLRNAIMAEVLHLVLLAAVFYLMFM